MAEIPEAAVEAAAIECERVFLPKDHGVGPEPIRSGARVVLTAALPAIHAARDAEVRELKEALEDAADALKQARNGLGQGLAHARELANDNAVRPVGQLALAMENHLLAAREAERKSRDALDSITPNEDDDRDPEIPEAAVEGKAVFAIDLDCAQAENIGEFHPDAISAAAKVVEALAEPGSREHRDAGIIAASAVAVALHVLAEEAGALPAIHAARDGELRERLLGTAPALAAAYAIEQAPTGTKATAGLLAALDAIAKELDSIGLDEIPCPGCGQPMPEDHKICQDCGEA